MELITNILVEYLKHNKRIVVPKLGAFIVKQPSGIIRFTDLMRNDDGVLRSLLIAYGISELEATGKIDRFVFEIRHAVSQGDKYTIAELGEFRAGENNTIVFHHKCEPKVIGGNIKPPVEALNMEKLKLGLMTNSIKMSESVAKPQNKSSQAKSSESSPISSNKPDFYLRGLNYDNRKKKRNDERTDKRRSPQRKRFLLLILIFIAIIGGVYALWSWLSDKPAKHQYTTIVANERSSEIDTLAIQDSLMMTEQLDSLQDRQAQAANSEINKPTK